MWQNVPSVQPVRFLLTGSDPVRTQDRLEPDRTRRSLAVNWAIMPQGGSYVPTDFGSTRWLALQRAGSSPGGPTGAALERIRAPRACAGACTFDLIGDDCCA